MAKSLCLPYFFVRGLKLVSDDDVALKGKLLVMCGSVFFTKFQDAYRHEQIEELAENTRLGMGAFIKALELLPPYSCEDRAEAFLNLGNFCLMARQDSFRQLSSTSEKVYPWHARRAPSASRRRCSPTLLRH
jgi:hypothetical protein